MNELSKTELTCISMLVDGYLRRPGASDEIDAGQHLDEDALNAFVEGSLSSWEAEPIVGHLVGCGQCRGVTTELVRLAIDMGELAEPQIVAPPDPEADEEE